MTLDTLGVDIACLDDLDPHFSLVSGAVGIGYAIARRISTGRGSLFYDRNYGIDGAAELNGEVTRGSLHQVRRETEREVAKDERVLSAQVSVTWVPSTETRRTEVRGKTKTGDFRLVQTPGDITVDELAGRS